MAIFIQSGETAHISEYFFFEHLIKKLPWNWVIIGNAELVDSQRTSSEVDAIVIGGGNIWALEAKCWSGPISGDSHTWIWNGGENKCKSPILVVQSKARILAGFSKKCNIKSFVNGYVVLLADPPNALNINSPDVPKFVFTKRNIVDSLMNMPKSQEIEQDKLRALIRKIGGKDAEKTFGLGGEKPKKPDKNKKSVSELSIKENVDNNISEDAQSDEYVITFSQQEGSFQRVYYNSEYKKILLGKGELRGSIPNVWQDWKYEGIYLHLLENGFSIECLPGSECTINNKTVPVGHLINVDKETGEISICGIKFIYKYEKYKGGI